MARQPRRIAGIGATDLPDLNAIKAYTGPSRELIADGVTLRVQDGVTPGGIPLARFDDSRIVGAVQAAAVGAATYIASGASAVRAIADRASDAVRPEDYRLPADPDDTLSLNRAAATGRLITLRDDRVYVISAGIPVSRGVVGQGKGARLQLVSGFSASGPNGVQNSFFYNKNWAATQLTDSDLLFQNLIMDATNNYNNGTFHAIKVRMASRVLVDNVVGIQGGNVTAFQACKDTLVDRSWAFGVGNCGFDSWEGPQNATVRDCTVYCGTNGAGVYGTGVMFSAASTDYTSGAGSNLLSKNNRVFGKCEVGVDFNILWSGGSLTNAVSDGDMVDAQGQTHTVGIRMIGNIVGGIIRNPVLLNGAEGNAIIVTPDSGPQASGTPAVVQVINPRVMNWTTSADNVAPIALLGSPHRLTGALVTGGTYPYAVRTSVANTTIEGQFDVGTSGYRFSTNNTAFNGLSYGSYGIALQAGSAIQTAIPDGTAQGGNARGSNAVDLSLVRTNQFQIASGFGSFNAGVRNAASGVFSSTLGGSDNVNGQSYAGMGGIGNVSGGAGAASFVWGNSNQIGGNATAVFGLSGSDRGHTGGLTTSSGAFATPGDAQSRTGMTLRGSGNGAGAFRLTADAGPAGSGNCVNLPPSAPSSYALSIRVNVFDATNPANTFSWLVPLAMLTKTTAANSSTVLMMSTASSVATNSWAPTVTATADTTNGGLNVTVTPPVGNADTVRAVARIESVEVQ